MKFIRFRILTHAIWLLPPILLCEWKSSDDTPEGFTPEKAFLSQHQDITSCKATNMVFQESVTLLHINYISVSHDQDAICVGPRNNITDGNPLSKRKLHGI